MSQVFGASLVPGAQTFGSGGLGILGSVIRSTTAAGAHGPGYLYNDWDGPEDDGKEFRGVITAQPSAGVFLAFENGSFTLTGAPDGSYSFTYQLYIDGVPVGSPQVSTITIGEVGIYRPGSDIASNGWAATGASSLFDCINETTPSDADYITSPDLTAPAIIGLTASLPAGSWSISVRAARVSGSGQMRVRLLNSSNVDVGGTAWQALSATPTTYTLAATTTAASDRMRIEVQP